jgi:hypothetical protein
MSSTAGEDERVGDTTPKIMAVVDESFDKGYTVGYLAGPDADPGKEATV